ncbi:FecR domain-containing protein [Chitinophaga sp. OAE865]|uniref:FecR family protein n=1 Tax=Chitinophaga sp. OAE865 TaxID=2817898 RepID=UPI001AE4D7AB
MLPSEFQYLVEKFLDDSITPEELQRFRQWVLEDRAVAIQEAAIEAVLQKNNYPGEMPEDKQVMFSYILEEANRRTATHSGRKTVNMRRWWAAAAVLLLLGAGFYFLTRTELPVAVVAQHSNNIIQPGREGAVLTLADGSQVVLDSLKNGVITQQGNTDVRFRNGQLLYNSRNNAASASLVYNTVATPRGRQFRVILPDGTAVWLNAASSLRYPVTFPEEERNVTVTGEAYFEVAADAHKPFTVKTDNGTAIRVLGTSFNVNAYTDESALRATLLQGKILVKTTTGNQVLLPGEQAVVGQSITVNKQANTSQAIAWKNGIFNFQQAPLEVVMRQISRWYDVEVVYEKNIPAITFGGEMGRDLELKDVLEFLQESGVHFKLSGRKLTVMP